MDYTNKKSINAMQVTPILIDITLSNNAKSFKNINEVIQKDAVKLFFEHVKSSLDKIKQHHPVQTEVEFSRYHDTIAVFGGRGTGKTTFILNVFELIRRASFDDDQRIKSMLPESLTMMDLAALQVLPILDPTLVEAKEHVFVNIISRIKEEAERHFRKISGGGLEVMDPCSPGTWRKKSDSDYSNQDWQDSCSSRQGAYRDWLETLRNLAAGLPALDGIGGNILQKESWQDPVHVMEEGLKCVRASNSLEKNFHCYVAKSLEFIGKKAFVLAFDDVDTDFQAGWPVLEIIRKYLTTPQLITVLSGDPGLYTQLIRKKQWDHFGKKFINLECPNDSRPGNRENFNYMVNQLEDQYFLKILKPERRIELKSILAHQKQNIEFDIKFSQDCEAPNATEPLNIFLDRRIIDIWSLGKNSTTIKIYRNFLLDEPIRTLVQILSGMVEGQKENSRSWDALVETYFSNLYRHGFVTDIRSMPPDKALTRLAKALAENQIFDRGYRLKPEFFDRSTNRLMLVLGATYTRMIGSNPDLFFDYFIKIGLTRQITLSEPGTGEPDKQSIFDRYMHFTGLYTGEDALTQSRYHTGFIRVDITKDKPVLDKNKTLLGTIVLKKYDTNSPMLTLKLDASDTYWSNFKKNIFQIYGTEKYGSIENNEESLAHSFYSPIKNWAKDRDIINVPCFYSYVEQLQDSLVSSWHSVLIGLPGQFIVTTEQEHTPFWSIHNLIACIGEIIRCEDGQDEGRTDAMKGLLLRNSQLRAYDLPIKVDRRPDSDSEPTSIHDQDSNSLKSDTSGRLDLFAKMLIQWRNCKPKDSLPVHIIAKIFARFYYSLGRVDDTGGVKYLGETFYRYIILFLNSVFIEEMLHRNPDSEIGRKNPSNKDDNFDNNMNKVFAIRDSGNFHRIKNKTPFFYWIICCPVWHPYLNPEGQLFKLIINSNLYKNILDIESITYSDFISVKYEISNNDNNTVIYKTLYSVLNAVLVQNMRDRDKSLGITPEKAETKLPSWKISRFEEIKENVKPDIDRLIKDNKNYDEITDYVVEKYIDGKFTNVPRNRNGKSFNLLKNKISTL